MLRLIPLLAAAAALLAAAPANAALKTGVFKASLTGSQTTTWHYEDTDDPNDPCDSASKGDGSQMMRFATKGPVKITALKGAMTNRRTMVAPFLKGTAELEREGEYAVANTAYDENACGPAVADGGGGTVDDFEDCGSRTIPITTQLVHNMVEPEIRAPKQAMWLTGDLDPWLGFLNCPWWIGGGEGPDEYGLIQSFEPFKDARLYDKRRKKITIAGHRLANHTAENFSGQTRITWTLRLTRVA
jgi:hypothetical protein